MNFSEFCKSTIKKVLLKPKKVQFDSSCYVNWTSYFDGNNKIGNNVEIINCTIGEYTNIGHHSSLKGTEIGKFCSIGPYTHILVGRHPINTWVSTSPAFYSRAMSEGGKLYSGKNFEDFNYVNGETVCSIGNDVWIGGGVSILDGIRIGDGAVVAAGAIVTKDVEPYSIVGGVPAKVLKYRFTEKQIKYLLDLKWWNRGIDWIVSNKGYFSNIDALESNVKTD